MTICLVSIVCTLLEILFPQGKMEKIFKVVLGAFMLCALLIPLKNTLKSINFDAKKNENFIKDEYKLKSTVDKQVKTSAKEKLQATIEKILAAKGVKPEKINIFMDTSADNSISIKKIEVFLPKGDENSLVNVKNELEKILELKVDVALGSE